MKSKVDKLHVNKLVLVPAELNKLSDVVDVVTKDVHIFLRSKILKI